MTIQTTWANGMHPLAVPEVEQLEVTQDRQVVGKYDLTFEAMTVGECIKCPSHDVKRIQSAMTDWIKRNNLPYKQAHMTRYPADGNGRVWLTAKGPK